MGTLLSLYTFLRLDFLPSSSHFAQTQVTAHVYFAERSDPLTTPLSLSLLLTVITCTDIFILPLRNSFEWKIAQRNSTTWHTRYAFSGKGRNALISSLRLPFSQNVSILSPTTNTCLASSYAFCDNLWNDSREHKMEDFPNRSPGKMPKEGRAVVH